MINLTATTEELVVEFDSPTVAASKITACVSGILITTSADTPFSQDLTYTTSGGDIRTILSAPSTDQQKVVKNIVVYNNSNGTFPNVIISKANSPTYYRLAKTDLMPGESIHYEDGTGWFKMDATGRRIFKYETPDTVPSVLTSTFNHARASIGTTVAGAEASFWRGTGLPLQGAIPAAAAACSASTTGAMPLALRSGTEVRRLVHFSISAATANQVIYLQDRLGHMGGLSGTVTTAQTINLNLSSLGNNVSVRKGSSDYQDVTWYLDWYTATGSTAATPTVNVTYADDTTGNCNIWNLGTTALPASVAASRRYMIISATGKGIKAVNSVTLSATTGTAGSFGVTAVRNIATLVSAVAYRTEQLNWDKSNAPVIHDDSCLTLGILTTATSTGLVTGKVQQDVSAV